MKILPEVPDNFQPTYLDLVLATLAAIGLPFAVPSYRLLLQMLWTSKIGKKKAIFGIASGPENLHFLKELLESNELRIVIDRTYPLEQIAEAHAYADEGHKVGSVAISVCQEEVIQ
ncbi:MAG: hypothetical protein ThorAB25_25720 [Candidatus Thorarchaeota archaeon AB_25]|nr:MAG: hypothetical protein ThorAB25_25720 [Candidatus Thorarchaeota archaeon AB_25]